MIVQKLTLAVRLESFLADSFFGWADAFALRGYGVTSPQRRCATLTGN
jgi:hypothetical protein